MGSITLEVNSGQLSQATYLQLRGRALAHVARDPGARGLDLRDVVQDAWLKLQSTKQWDSRAHFFGAASRAVRQILVDAARRRVRDRRAMQALGAKSMWSEPAAGVAEPLNTMTAERIVILDELVRELGAIDERWGAVAQMRVFGNVSNEDIARELGVDARTIQRDYRHAKRWIGDRLAGIPCQSRRRMSGAGDMDA